MRDAELCWGQRYHWLRYQQAAPADRHDAHIVVGCPVPDGVPLTALRTVLDYLVRRHEGLRTVIDPYARPVPRQVVQPPRPLTLHAASTETDQTPAPAEVIAALTERPFDMAAEWPIRVCAVTTGGAPRRLVVVLHHLAFDDWGLALFQKEFGELVSALTSRRRAQLPPVARQPADLATTEAALGRTGREAALEHWRALVPSLPADPFGRRRAPSPDGPAAHSATLTSPGLLGAVREIAGRLRVWPSAVHLAAHAMATAAWTGETTVAHRWLASHREGDRMSVLTCMFSPALVRFELAGDPGFAEVTARVAEQLEQAQRHAYAPWDEVAELVAREGFRRGRPLRVTSEVNFLSSPAQRCGSRRDRLVRGAEPAAWARSGTDSYFRVRELADGVALGLDARAEVMDAEAVEAFLQGCVRLLTAHAEDPALDLPLSEAAGLFGFAPPAAPAPERLGEDLVRPAAVASALRAHPAVAAAEVTVRNGRLEARVTARTAVGERELRRTTLDAAAGLPGVSRPDRFTITVDAGAEPDDDAGGSGAPAPAPTGAAAREALLRAVGGANGLSAVDAEASYTAAGGRLLLGARVRAELWALGWSGLEPAELAGVRPLAALAARLRPADTAGAADTADTARPDHDLAGPACTSPLGG
ncbi:condensation domain-containing protein [Streptomyces otsuchiensis]|uniref:condensation domain-containing protein n=1 Tax=Streptomyces otsuchiensis TaxID=2681388 RepID=UPI001476EE87|nr:condensation domain-containing protein [Streptomyces otsuchiensis]